MHLFLLSFAQVGALSFVTPLAQGKLLSIQLVSVAFYTPRTACRERLKRSVKEVLGGMQMAVPCDAGSALVTATSGTSADVV